MQRRKRTGKRRSSKTRLCASCRKREARRKYAAQSPEDLRGTWIDNFYVTDASPKSLFFDDNRAELFWADLGTEDFDASALSKIDRRLMSELDRAHEEKIRVGGTTADVIASHDTSGLTWFLNDDMSFNVSFSVYFDTPPELTDDDLDILRDVLLTVAGSVESAMLEASHSLNDAFFGNDPHAVSFHDSRL